MSSAADPGPVQHGPLRLEAPVPRALAAADWAAADALGRRVEWERAGARPAPDQLWAADLRTRPAAPHQVEAARDVLADLGGSALLADPVGAGGHVEAALVLAELVARGRGDQVLVCAAPGMAGRWHDEVRADHGIALAVADGPGAPALDRARVVLDHDLAEAEVDRLASRRWDLVVVDDAHQVAGDDAEHVRFALRRIAAGAGAVLVVSPSPARDGLVELRRLVELVRPGTLPAEDEMRARFIDPDVARATTRPPELRAAVAPVLVRRADAAVASSAPFVVDHHEAVLDPDELDVARRALALARQRLRHPADWPGRAELCRAAGVPGPGLAALAHRLAGSATSADDRAALGELAARAGRVRPQARLRLVVALARLWAAEHRRVVVAVACGEDAHLVADRLDDAGVAAAVLEGDSSAATRAAAVASWRRGEATALVVTDEVAASLDPAPGGATIWFDLPWDPFVAEARLRWARAAGPDVPVATFVAAGSVDAEVVALFDGPLRWFSGGLAQARSLLAELDPVTLPRPSGDDAPASFADRVALAVLGGAEPDAPAGLLEEVVLDVEAARRRVLALTDGAERLARWALVDDEDERRAQGRGDGEEDEGAAEAGSEDGSEAEGVAEDGFFAARPARPTGDGGGARRDRAARPPLRAGAHEARLRDLVVATVAAVGGSSRRREAVLEVAWPQDGGPWPPARLVFSPRAAAEHLDAALVAPGSAACASFLELVRRQVPVQVDVAESVDLPGLDEVRRAPGVELVDRWVEPPSTWSATSTWTVEWGAGADADEVVEVGSGEEPERGLPRRPLDHGEPLPAAFPAPAALVEHLCEAAGGALRERAEAVAAAVDAEAEDAQVRLAAHHRGELDRARAAMDEAPLGSGAHERAVARLAAVEATGPGPDHRAVAAAARASRAVLGAVHLRGGDDVSVVERWRGPDGGEAECRWPWDADAPAARLSQASGLPLVTLAVCAEGHLVDEAELVVCPCCGASGCPVCELDRALEPCPLCRTPTCGRCRTAERSDGPDDAGVPPDGVRAPCRACRDPQRRREADGATTRAWSLGGDAWVEVGRRWAVVHRPEEGPEVVVADADLDDPARRRLRGAADVLGLPLDLGTGRRDRPARPLPAGTDVWVASELGETWEVVEGWGEELAEPVDDLDAPDGPQPCVLGEEELGAGALLAQLREREPPPAPPALVRTPHLDVARIAVEAEGLRRTVVRHRSEGEPEVLAEERASFEPAGAESDVAHLLRPVAEAALGPVRLVLLRAHRSLVARLVTPGGTTERFVAAPGRTTFGGELAWASWLEDEGVAPGVVLARPEHGPALAEEDLAAPATVTLVERRVTEVWGTEPVEGGDGGDGAAGVDGTDPGAPRPADDDDLARLGYVEVPDLDLPALPSGLDELGRHLRQAADRLDPAGSRWHRLVHRRFELAEHWRGRSDVHLTYKVAPGEPAWPRLDDTHRRAEDFEVDDHGHLHVPGAGWACLACREHHCPACGPVGAMAPCDACGQEACGLCRARHARSVPEERCDRCGVRSCGECGREPGTRRCPLCRRAACQPCRAADGRCRTCAAVRPASAEELAGLPAVLAAEGAHGWLGQADGEVVVVLLGARRSEVAVLDGSRATWWVHLDDRPAGERRLALAVGRAEGVGGDLDVVVRARGGRPEPTGPALLLVAEDEPDVRWRVEVEGRAFGSTPAPEDPADPAGARSCRGEVVQEVLARMGLAAGAEPEPAPADPTGDPVEALRAGRRFDPAGRVLVEDRPTARRTWLNAEGIERAVVDGDGERRTAARWQVGVTFSWMLEGWEPAPTVVAHALHAGFEAALVRVGRHLALGVRAGDRVVWWTLRDQPDDLQRALLGGHLTGEDRVLDLRVVTDPGKVEGPTVVGATFVDRRIEPVLAEVPADAGDPDHALRAAAAWVRREAASPVGGSPGLPEDLRAALVARADELSPPTAEPVGIALQVVETWRQGLDQFPIAYRLEPGRTEAVLACAATGQPTQVVHRDRSGHLVATVEVCASCQAELCAACHDRPVPCPVCALAICRRCALPDGRCATCASLAPLDRKDAKALGLRTGRRGVAVRAGSGDRLVTAVRDDGWTVRVEVDGAPVFDGPATPDGAAVLDAVAAAGPPPGPVPDERPGAEVLEGADPAGDRPG